MAIGIQVTAALICTRCGKVTHNKVHYCDECYPVYQQKKIKWQQYQEKKRKQNGKKGRLYDKAFWKRLRVQILERDNYLCVACMKLGKLTPATDVDHIVPLSKGGTNSPDNLQALCHECHKQKTAKEDSK